MDDQSSKNVPEGGRGFDVPVSTDVLDVSKRIQDAVDQAGGLNEDQAESSLVGRTIAGKFKVVELVGRGGMGAVYKARQAGMDRFVAIKVLLRELSANQKVVKRFKIEALAASRLAHPNTIRIYDFGQTDDGILYMAMEFLEGQSLSRAIRQDAPMPAARVLHIVSQMAASLEEAHSKGIVHRDLKPDNVFLTRVGEDRDFVKVLDFGVAKLREADRKQGTLTQAGMIFGTPRYMSPEQCRSMPVDHRADIYAIGAIAYEMLAGVPPFIAENPLAILIRHVQDEPEPFRLVRPDIQVPMEVEALVRHCLEKAPENRFQDCGELRRAVDRVLMGLGDGHDTVVRVPGRQAVQRIPSDHQPTLAKTEVSAARPAELEKPRTAGFRKPALFLVGALVAGAVAGVWWVSGRPVGSPSEPSDTQVYRPTSANTTTPGAAAVDRQQPKARDSKRGVAFRPKPAIHEKVALRVRTTPRGARVLLDGRYLGVTPLDAELDRASTPVKLELVKNGYRTKSISLVLDSDRQIDVTLARRRRPRPASGPRAGPSTGRVAPGSTKKGPGKVGDLKAAPF